MRKTAALRKSGIVAVCAALALTFSGAIATLNVSAEELPVDLDWEVVKEAGVTGTYDKEGGFSSLKGFADIENKRVVYSNALHLDGLTVSMETKDVTPQDYYGLMFVPTKTTYWGSTHEGGLAIGAIAGFTGSSLGACSVNRTDFGVGSGYSYYAGEASNQITYSSIDRMVEGQYGPGTELATRFISNYRGGSDKVWWGFDFTFEKKTPTEEEAQKLQGIGETEYWTLTVTERYSGILTTTYGQKLQAVPDGDGRKFITVYLKGSLMENIVNEEGDCYVLAYGDLNDYDAGTAGDAIKAKHPESISGAEKVLRLKVEDKYKREAPEKVTAALEAYDTALEGKTEIDDIVEYYKLAGLRSAVLEAIEAVNPNGRAEYRAQFDEVDERLVLSERLEKIVYGDDEFEDTYGESLVRSYDPETGYTRIGGFSTYDKGIRSAFSQKIHLDGATVYLRDPSLMRAGDRLGFMFGDNKEVYWNSGGQNNKGFTVMAFRGWDGNSINTNQTGIGINLGYEIKPETCLGYKSTDDMLTDTHNYGYSTRIVTRTNSQNTNTFPSDWGFAVSFEHVEEAVGSETDYWKVTFTELYPDLLSGWGGNRTGTDEEGRQYFTAYVKGSSLVGILDENGDAYLSAVGIDREVTEDVCQFEIRVEDNHTAAGEGKLTAAEEKFKSLSGLLDGEGAESFEAYATAYEGLAASIEGIRPNESKKYRAYLEGFEATVRSDTGLQSKLNAHVGAGYTAAETAMQFEGGFSSEKLEEARGAIAAAGELLEKWRGLLTETNITALEGRGTALEARVTQAEKTVAFLTAVQTLDTEGTLEERFEALAAVYALHAGLDGTEQARSETAAALQTLGESAADYNEAAGAVNDAYRGAADRWAGLSA